MPHMTHCFFIIINVNNLRVSSAWSTTVERSNSDIAGTCKNLPTDKATWSMPKKDCLAPPGMVTGPMTSHLTFVTLNDAYETFWLSRWCWEVQSTEITVGCKYWLELVVEFQINKKRNCNFLLELRGSFRLSTLSRLNHIANHRCTFSTMGEE